jgi:hypothetical protein
MGSKPPPGTMIRVGEPIDRRRFLQIAAAGAAGAAGFLAIGGAGGGASSATEKKKTRRARSDGNRTPTLTRP